MLVVLTALAAGTASAAEERVVALEGSLLTLTYDQTPVVVTLPPFEVVKNGQSRELTGVKIKVYQRPSFGLIVDAFQPVNETFAYRIHATTEVVVYNGENTMLGSNIAAISTSKRSGRFVNGHFSTWLSFAGPNDVSILPQSYPKRLTPNDDVSGCTVSVMGTIGVTDVRFKTTTGAFWDLDPFIPEGMVTVVAIFTYEPMP